MKQILEHDQQTEDELIPFKIQETTASDILREYSGQFDQITGRYSDGSNGRCAIGVLSSYFGWDGRDKDKRLQYDSQIHELITPETEVKILKLNDSGKSFKEIADIIED